MILCFQLSPFHCNPNKLATQKCTFSRCLQSFECLFHLALPPPSMAQLKVSSQTAICWSTQRGSSFGKSDNPHNSSFRLGSRNCKGNKLAQKRVLEREQRLLLEGQIQKSKEFLSQNRRLRLFAQIEYALPQSCPSILEKPILFSISPDEVSILHIDVAARQGLLVYARQLSAREFFRVVPLRAITFEFIGRSGVISFFIRWLGLVHSKMYIFLSFNFLPKNWLKDYWVSS